MRVQEVVRRVKSEGVGRGKRGGYRGVKEG